MAADEVLDQWDAIADAGELSDTLLDAIEVAGDYGRHFDGDDVPIFVVPCVPDEPIPPGARITGVKVARVADVVGIYLFAEAAA